MIFIGAPLGPCRIKNGIGSCVLTHKGQIIPTMDPGPDKVSARPGAFGATCVVDHPGRLHSAQQRVDEGAEPCHCDIPRTTAVSEDQFPHEHRQRLGEGANAYSASTQDYIFEV